MPRVNARDLRSRLSGLFGLQPGPRVDASFVARTTAAAVFTLLISARLHVVNPIWAVVSAVVVILPEVRASVSSAAIRVIANLVGAGTGFVVSLLHLAPVSSLLLALPVAAILCRVARIDPAARTASVAVAIVLLKDPFDVKVSSEARVGLVVLGCSIALAVTLLAAPVEWALARGRRGKPSEHPPSERPDDGSGGSA
jgi:uncharacterized membrane protein YgaE (UPF0421/DUF939 family)